jgi:hypothetical protein
MDRELTTILTNFNKRLDDLERRLAQTEKDAHKGMRDAMFAGVLKYPVHQSLIREMFLLEIIREAGLLDKVDIGEIEKKVRNEHAVDPGWSITEKDADLNLQMVVGELGGVYKDADDYDPDAKHE